MTHKRKAIYLSVIGVGLAAVVVDRLRAGGPAPAAGAVTTARSGKAGQVAPARPVQTPAPTPGGLERLRVSVLPFPQCPSDGPAEPAERDPFAMPPAVVAALTPPPAEEERANEHAEEAQRVETLAAFSDRHVLSGVMLLGEERLAVLDGMSVQVGTPVDECVVAAIATRSVSFTCPGGPVELHLQSPLPRAEIQP